MSKQDVSLTQQEPASILFFPFLSEIKFLGNQHNFMKLFYRATNLTEYIVPNFPQ